MRSVWEKKGQSRKRVWILCRPRRLEKCGVGDGVQDTEGGQILWHHQSWHRGLREDSWMYLTGATFTHHAPHCTELQPLVAYSSAITEVFLHLSPVHRHMSTQGRG